MCMCQGLPGQRDGVPRAPPVPGAGWWGPHPLLDGSMPVLHLPLLHGRVDHQLVQLWEGASGRKGPLSLRPWLGPSPPLPQAYLGRQLLHVGVQLVQQAVALLEEAVLGVHEGQHLQGEAQVRPPPPPDPRRHTCCPGPSSRAAPPPTPRQALTESKISNFFLAWRTLICRGRGEPGKGVGVEAAHGLRLATESARAACGSLRPPARLHIPALGPTPSSHGPGPFPGQDGGSLPRAKPGTPTPAPPSARSPGLHLQPPLWARPSPAHRWGCPYLVPSQDLTSAFWSQRHLS